MNTITKLASVTLVALLLGTSMASAFPVLIDVTPQDNTPVDIPSYDPTPVDLDPYDPTPVDLPYNGPINVYGDYTPVDIPSKGKGQGQGQGQAIAKGSRDIQLAFACAVDTDADLVVTNTGDAVPAGTRLKWEVRSLGAGGYFKLGHDLASGQKVRVADVAGGLDAGTKCAAKAI